MAIHKTVLQVEVLSEDQGVGELSLLDIAHEIVQGDCSGVVKVTEQVALTDAQAREALIAQGSDPSFLGSFLGLDDDEDEDAAASPPVVDLIESEPRNPAPVIVEFSDDPLVDDPRRVASLDVEPFLRHLCETNMPYAGQWVEALANGAEDPYAFLGEVDVDSLVDWAKASGEIDFYGFAMRVEGASQMSAEAGERCNVLPRSVDTQALWRFARASLSPQVLDEVNKAVAEASGETPDGAVPTPRG